MSARWIPLLCTLVVVGALLGGLLAGFEPVGGDPDRIFRPIKAELAEGLREGRLPYWSERLGLGVPLVAESHVAAFYPLNWVLYSTLSVSLAYRLAMWAHYVALAGATFAYARRLGIAPWGSSLSALSFTFCGFQTIHSSHEWAYHTLVYLPLVLLVADRYAATGEVRWLAWLGLLWGLQITLGHFQVASWTGALAVVVGGWQVVSERRPVARILGLAAGLAWGATIALVQLAPSWELARMGAQLRRSYATLAAFAYPPAHLPELLAPGLYRWLPDGYEGAYWNSLDTTGYEACLFVGTVPLILAAIGFVGAGCRLTPWRILVPASLALATMPHWWPGGYAALLKLPGLGLFRCPARYTAIASFGLALLAGAGLDRSISTPRFRAGLVLVLLWLTMALAWSLAWPRLAGESFRANLSAPLMMALGVAGLTWIVAAAVVASWRRDGSVAVLLVFTAMELGAWYYLGPTRWGRPIVLPEASPILSLLASDPGAHRIGGELDNLPIRSGLATATPYTGFPLPSPHILLRAVQEPRLVLYPQSLHWHRRFRVTHFVNEATTSNGHDDTETTVSDPVLDRLSAAPSGRTGRRRWRIRRVSDVFPEARVVWRSHVGDLQSCMGVLTRGEARDEVCFLTHEAPPPFRTPHARTAAVTRWDRASLTADVAHDGACDLVLSRAYYPGWRASVNSGPPSPVSRTAEGFVAVRLDHPGPSRVTLQYRPTHAPVAIAASLVGFLAAGITISRRKRRGPEAPFPGP